MSEMIIQTEGLTKKYRGRYAVDHLNLEIAKGDIYGFLGPNGAGKTTTIRMLLGLIQPTSGSIRIFGRELQRDKLAILRRIGSLVESPSYYGHLSAIDNLEAIRRILQVPKSRIDEVLDIVSLSSEARRPVKGFSLGMKQRLGIAASLLGNPELLILDEPTNGLDPSGIHEIRELIKSMPKRYGITVLVSSHLLGEMELMASKVGIIREGRMVFQDTIDNLRLQAAHDMELVVSEPDEALWVARDLGAIGKLRSGVLSFPGMADAQVARLVKQLVENGHAIYRVEQKKKSLEDIFMQVIGEGTAV
ncbi:MULTISPECIES: ABC transporter ATP-binding protein [Paenibacillus]|uniref:Antibiotic transport system ATP-binding protein n=2 Tax=Paenibacillus barengoltzii TaxID=343517 RepID=R9L755_9BACL|nr:MULTISPECIES: ABC transporter ATP-binding protein [Paenibacillus]EOS54383.1 antibiotic transport system ATP-binding protein [Paenibacillus barengoltzii G22]MDU0329578.1 ABC transporter ATP-binding protein [Paenibacillus sp. 3LSP]SMF25571.1 ABC-2 type transport system ATP-binding protein [Paenibacillus barengoltzii J12]SMF36255.1 ABC-2 type transport system ATP-binding protein [Paenibacillus barengoltzii]